MAANDASAAAKAAGIDLSPAGAAFAMGFGQGMQSPQGGDLVFTYFPLWAKGPGPALALAFSGLSWTGGFDYGADLAGYGTEWLPKHKKDTAWGFLPTLDAPGVGQVAHEMGVLNFIGRKVPAMAGASLKDFSTSQQLMGVGEDIYLKLNKNCDTILQKDKTDKATRDAWWAVSDAGQHNATYSLGVYLGQLEKFHAACGAGAGKYTDTGTTVGECKLFATLHACVMIKADCLDAFPAVKGFYARMLGEEKTKWIMAGGPWGRENFFGQYFVATAGD